MPGTSVSEILDVLKLNSKSKIIRHPVTNRMTSVLNGNRFVNVALLSYAHLLQEFSSVNGMAYVSLQTIKIIKEDFCAQIAGTVCKMCKELGYFPGDYKCCFFAPQQNVIAFSCKNNVLFSFFLCDIKLH